MKINTFKLIAMLSAALNIVTSIFWGFIIHNYDKAYDRAELGAIFCILWGILDAIEKNKCQKGL